MTLLFSVENEGCEERKHPPPSGSRPPILEGLEGPALGSEQWKRESVSSEICSSHRKKPLRNFKQCISNLKGFLLWFVFFLFFFFFPLPSGSSTVAPGAAQGWAASLRALLCWKRSYWNGGVLDLSGRWQQCSLFLFAGYTVWSRHPPAHHYRLLHRLYSVSQRLPYYRLHQNGFQDNTLWTKERLALSCE